MKDFNVFAGKKIKEYREERELTQEQVAKELDIAPNHFGRIERGENSCTMSNLIQICNLLKVTPNDILGGLVITKDDDLRAEIDRLNLEDKKMVLSYIKFLLSKY